MTMRMIRNYYQCESCGERWEEIWTEPNYSTCQRCGAVASLPTKVEDVEQSLCAQLQQGDVRTEQAAAQWLRQLHARVTVPSTLYALEYCDQVGQRDYQLLSLHQTLAGAERARDEHRRWVYDTAPVRSDRHPNSPWYPAWRIKPTEVQT